MDFLGTVIACFPPRSHNCRFSVFGRPRTIKCTIIQRYILGSNLDLNSTHILKTVMASTEKRQTGGWLGQRRGWRYSEVTSKSQPPGGAVPCGKVKIGARPQGNRNYRGHPGSTRNSSGLYLSGALGVSRTTPSEARGAGTIGCQNQTQASHTIHLCLT